jgi:hypothetical protein
VKRLFWGVLAVAQAVACGASPAAPGAEPSGRGSIQPVVAPGSGAAAAASPPPSAGAPAPREMSDFGPPPRCCPSAGDGAAIVRCDPDRIVPEGPLLFHPDRPRPPAPQRATLDAVAGLMHRRQDILLLRVEVSSHRPASNAAQQRRAMQQAQRRADAVFRYLWRRRRVSAERMESVGLSAPAPGGNAAGYSTVLRIIQWAPSARSAASSTNAGASCDEAASP